MRLSTNQIDTIINTAKQLLGESTMIWLFGSRVDDTKKGGDIDLYIETETIINNRAAKTCQYIALLQQELGEQRFDVIIVDPKTSQQPIFEVAKETGIRL